MSFDFNFIVPRWSRNSVYIIYYINIVRPGFLLVRSIEKTRLIVDLDIFVFRIKWFSHQLLLSWTYNVRLHSIKSNDIPFQMPSNNRVRSLCFELVAGTDRTLPPVTLKQMSNALFFGSYNKKHALSRR